MSGDRFELGDGATVVEVKAHGDVVTELEVTVRPGSGAPPHVHTRESETIVVVDGSLRVGDETLGPGGTLHLARGVRHAFVNEGDGPARALFVCVPGGLERFFRAIADPPPSDEELAAAAEAAGLRFG